MSFFFKIFDIPLYIVIIICILYPFLRINNNSAISSKIEVIKDRNTVAIINRHIDSVYNFDDFSVEVKNNSCRIIKSNCADHLCERSGWLDSASSKRIICLPHKIIVKNNFYNFSDIDEITE